MARKGKDADGDCDGGKPHGWEQHNGGKPPFPGAAPPIHLHQGGKFLKGSKGPKK